ncbi:hypothetical protein [Enterobacter hormaechei]|uniref:hypothetical protein n=1 Tax=Enterobacter hormaechei TaxID=158836 RepID=UPI002FEF28CF
MLNSHFESTLLVQYVSVGAGLMECYEDWTLEDKTENIKFIYLSWVENINIKKIKKL